MGCMFLFTEDRPDVSIPALEYASFGSVPYNIAAKQPAGSDRIRAAVSSKVPQAVGKSSTFMP